MLFHHTPTECQTYTRTAAQSRGRKEVVKNARQHRRGNTATVVVHANDGTTAATIDVTGNSDLAIGLILDSAERIFQEVKEDVHDEEFGDLDFLIQLYIEHKARLVLLVCIRVLR